MVTPIHQINQSVMATLSHDHKELLVLASLPSLKTEPPAKLAYASRTERDGKTFIVDIQPTIPEDTPYSFQDIQMVDLEDIIPVPDGAQSICVELAGSLRILI